MKKYFVLSLILFINFIGVADDSSINERDGRLEFYNKVGKNYSNVFFVDAAGKKYDVFSKNLKFSRSISEDISPDHHRAVVNFSLSGRTDDSNKSTDSYFCGFIDMKTGCIEKIISSEECGGKWNEKSRWLNPDGSEVRDQSLYRPKVKNIAEVYYKGLKNSTVLNIPKIKSYLEDSTTLTNVLRCDPLDVNNKKYYDQIISKMKADGDVKEANEFESILER